MKRKFWQSEPGLLRVQKIINVVVDSKLIIFDLVGYNRLITEAVRVDLFSKIA